MRAADVAAALTADRSVLDRRVVLALDGVRIAIRSDCAALLDLLEGYFAHVVGDGPSDIDVVAIESDPVVPDLPLADWAREPGKTGRKDAYADLDDGRVVQKVRTGMLFLQSARHRVAVGPCLAHPNQVVNYVNAQYMNVLQQRGALICHAAAVVIGGRALGLASFSGGGKSTLMLRLLADPDARYLTNDRLFLRREADHVRAIGIPKLPRVNPGTVVHDPNLRGMLDDAERAAWLAMPPAELWKVERKYDVDVTARYGPGKIASAAPLAGMVVLGWRLGTQGGTRFERLDPDMHRGVLGAIMKSPGPFFQAADGAFIADTDRCEEHPYLELLAGVPVISVTGAVDFERAAAHCLGLARQ